jgi:hypothetical protein
MRKSKIKLSSDLGSAITSLRKAFSLLNAVANADHPLTLTEAVELEFPPIAFDSARLSCRCDFPGPAELGAVNPYAVHDHGQPARQRHDRLFHPAVPGDLHRPGLDQDHLAECTSMLWAAT